MDNKKSDLRKNVDNKFRDLFQAMDEYIAHDMVKENDIIYLESYVQPSLARYFKEKRKEMNRYKALSR